MFRALVITSLVITSLFGLAGCDEVAWRTPVAHLDRMALSVWGDNPKNVFVAGGALGGPQGALALHFDGDRWRELSGAGKETLWWVYGFGRDRVWFCGENGTILHWDGATFSSQPTGTNETLYGLWGPAPDDLWAVGGAPELSSVILHFDGKTWSPVSGAPDNQGSWFKVWGTSSKDVFVVGQHGSIAHFDGAAWTKMPSGLGPTISLLTVAGRAPDDVYAVGGQGVGVALHYDGQSWSRVAGLAADETSGLAGVSVSPSGDVAVVGLAGAKLRGRGSTWTDDTLRPPRVDLHATLVFGPDDIFAVGGNLNAPAGYPREGTVAHYGFTLPTFP